MNNFGWKEVEYGTWDEAFRGLVPKIRQQSVRVAAYAQVIYNQACASSFGKQYEGGSARIQEKYSDLAYKCGLYHQIGKTLLEPEIQLWNKGFSDAQKVKYQSYTTGGRLFVSYLQEKNDRTKKKKNKSGEDEKFCGVEHPTDNIAWLMVRETCEQHMERWDGSGYPNGLMKNEISPIAQIVGLAREFDELATKLKSENPFDEAFEQILEMEGKAFSQELIEVFRACKGKIRPVFRKYIRYSNALPKTIHLVDKRDDRPMGLTYRKAGPDLYEAVPFFKGSVEEPERKDSLEELEPLMVRSKVLDDVMFYLLYEACDTVLRMQNCRLKTEGVYFKLPEGFYTEESKLGKFHQVFLDQPIDTSRLLLGVPEPVLLSNSAKLKEVLKEYVEAGVHLVVDSYNPKDLSPAIVREIGFSGVRFSEDVDEKIAEYTAAEMAKAGIKVVGHSDPEEEFTEEEIVRKLLLGERQ